MAITALTLLKLSDTFNTLKDRINEIITKINKVDLEQNRLVLTNVSTQPIINASMVADTTVIWVDGDTDPPELKITINPSDTAGSATTYTLDKTAV